MMNNILRKSQNLRLKKENILSVSSFDDYNKQESSDIPDILSQNNS